jgi:hypothetical protein
MSTNEAMKNVFEGLEEKFYARDHLENLGLDREDNIKLDLKETGLEAEG